MVEQRRVTVRHRVRTAFLTLFWVLLQVGQLEASAQQQVQELCLQDRKLSMKKQQDPPMELSTHPHMDEDFPARGRKWWGY